MHVRELALHRVQQRIGSFETIHSITLAHIREQSLHQSQIHSITKTVITRSKNLRIFKNSREFLKLLSKVFANTTISRCKSCFKTRQIENWKTQLHWMLQSTACFSSVTQTCSLPTNFLIIDIYNWVRVGKAGLIGRATTIIVEYLKHFSF